MGSTVPIPENIVNEPEIIMRNAMQNDIVAQIYVVTGHASHVSVPMCSLPVLSQIIGLSVIPKQMKKYCVD